MLQGSRRDDPARPQARDPDRRAHRGAHQRRHRDEREHVAEPLERGSEVRHAPQQPNGADRLERVPERDAGGAGDRHVGGPVEQEGAHRDAGPVAHTKQQQGGEGDARGRPRGGDDLLGNGGEQTEFRRAEVGDGDGGKLRGVPQPTGQLQEVTSRDHWGSRTCSLCTRALSCTRRRETSRGRPPKRRGSREGLRRSCPAR